MRRLTNKERDQVLYAAHLIETGRHVYTCNALDQASKNTRLSDKYASFYGMSDYAFWPGLRCFSLWQLNEKVPLRVLMLLTFAQEG